MSSTGTITNAIRYAGQWYDSETGFYYLRARYYDPAVGRFTQRDTWSGDTASPYSLNPYLYGYNSPVILTDPSGHCIEDACIIEIAIATAAYETAPEWAPVLEDEGQAALEQAVEAADVAGEWVEDSGAECKVAQAYNTLRGTLAGTGQQAHHLVELRFLPLLRRITGDWSLKAGQMYSVAVTPEEHQDFTNAWRQAIGYITDNNPVNAATATEQQLKDAIQSVYPDHPDLLRAAMRQLGLQ